MALHVGQVTKEIVTGQAAVDLGVCIHLFGWSLSVAVLEALVVSCVVDLHVADGVSGVVAVLTHEALHHVVRLHVSLQMGMLNGFIVTPGNKDPNVTYPVSPTKCIVPQFLGAG